MSKSIPAAHPTFVSAAKTPRAIARFILRKIKRRDVATSRRALGRAMRGVGVVQEEAFKHFRIQL